MSEFVVLKVLEALDDPGQDDGFFLKTTLLLLMKRGTKNNREQPKTIGMISGAPGQSSTDRVLMIFAQKPSLHVCIEASQRVFQNDHRLVAMSHTRHLQPPRRSAGPRRFGPANVYQVLPRLSHQ